MCSLIIKGMAQWKLKLFKSPIYHQVHGAVSRTWNFNVTVCKHARHIINKDKEKSCRTREIGVFRAVVPPYGNEFSFPRMNTVAFNQSLLVCLIFLINQENFILLHLTAANTVTDPGCFLFLFSLKREILAVCFFLCLFVFLCFV